MVKKYNPDLKHVRVFSGTSLPKLSKSVAHQLDMPLGNIDIERFSDGETKVEINEAVRGNKIYFIHSTCPPVNDNLMELFITVDAFMRTGAEKVIAVIPYYGYSRQDRRPGYSRTPITSRLVANMLKRAGVSTVITINLHSGQQQGFFDIPITELSAHPLIVADIYRHNKRNNDAMIISPDAGGVVRAREVSKQLDDADMAIIDKRREKANQSKVMNVLGNVAGRDCAMVDDLIDTAGTLMNGAQALKDNGAERIVAYATHGVFSGPAFERIEKSVLDEVIVCDTIPLPEDKPDKIRTIPVTDILSEAIERMEARKSISEMYT